MKRIKEGWKKLRYWQKCGILFGIVHIALLCLVIDQKGHAAIGLAFVEFPFIFIDGAILYPLLDFGISDLFRSTLGNHAFFITGTVIYFLLGALFGIVINLIHKRRVKNV